MDRVQEEAVTKPDQRADPDSPQEVLEVKNRDGAPSLARKMEPIDQERLYRKHPQHK